MGQTHLQRYRWAALLSAGLLFGSGGVWSAAVAVPQPGPGMGPGPMGMQQSDQHFIVMMIPHHDGAIAMAVLALKRAKRPEIRTLAEQIKTSQTTENAQMRRWYRQWFGSDVPAWRWGGHGHGMPGMGTSLQALQSAPDFDRAFIEQMVPHHRMGVMMASHAQWNTRHRQLRELEEAMVTVQTREIAQMEKWYRQWYGIPDR